MNFNDYYMHLGVTPPPSEEAEEPEEEQESTSSPPSSSGPTYGPENPAPPNYGGPPPVYYGMTMPPPASTSPNTGGISLPPPPVRPPTSKPSNTGGWSLPPPPRRDPRPDDSRTEGSTDDSDNDRTRPGRIVEELQDERPEYSDDLTQAVGAAYGDVNDIYFQLYYGQSAVRMNDFAESGLDDESDERAEEQILRRVERVRRETMTDLADDRWESIVAIDTKTGEKVFWRYGSRNYTFLQEEQRKMVEGREIALIHNHPNNTAASQADLEGAFWLGAKSLTVVTPSGYRYVYIRGTNGMELAAVINDPNYVANPSWREDVESSTAFWTQTLAEKGNQPEWIMRQEEREDGIYTPVGLTVEQTYRLFAADKERIQRLKLPLGAYHNTRDQHRLSPWEDMWTKDPESWTDYGILEKLGPIIQSAAERWNHPESGMSDYEVAILLIANLHQESRFRRTSGVAGLLEDNGHQSIGWIGDKLGDMSILLSFWPIHSNPSLGPANLRATVADEMLQGELSIPMLQGENLELEDWQLDAEQLNSLNNLREEWREFRWDDHRGRLLFLSDDMKAIELAAINFYRGVERLQDGELQPTMFNMSAWMSQGIAESATLSTHDIGVVAGAIEHASDTVRFVNAIIANRETFGMFGDSEEIIDWDDFDLFNDNDLLAYLRDY